MAHRRPTTTMSADSGRTPPNAPTRRRRALGSDRCRPDASPRRAFAPFPVVLGARLDAPACRGAASDGNCVSRSRPGTSDRPETSRGPRRRSRPPVRRTSGTSRTTRTPATAAPHRRAGPGAPRPPRRRTSTWRSATASPAAPRRRRPRRRRWRPPHAAVGTGRAERTQVESLVASTGDQHDRLEPRRSRRWSRAVRSPSSRRTTGPRRPRPTNCTRWGRPAKERNAARTPSNVAPPRERRCRRPRARSSGRGAGRGRARPPQPARHRPQPRAPRQLRGSRRR